MERTTSPFVGHRLQEGAMNLGTLGTRAMRTAKLERWKHLHRVCESLLSTWEQPSVDQAPPSSDASQETQKYFALAPPGWKENSMRVELFLVWLSQFYRLVMDALLWKLEWENPIMENTCGQDFHMTTLLWGLFFIYSAILWSSQSPRDWPLWTALPTFLVVGTTSERYQWEVLRWKEEEVRCFARCFFCSRMPPSPAGQPSSFPWAQ